MPYLVLFAFIHVGTSFALATILVMVYRRLYRADYLLYWAMFWVAIGVNLAASQIAAPLIPPVRWLSLGLRAFSSALFPFYLVLTVCAGLSLGDGRAKRLNRMLLWGAVTVSVALFIAFIAIAPPEGAALSLLDWRPMTTGLAVAFFAWKLTRPGGSQAGHMRQALVAVAAVYALHNFAAGSRLLGMNVYSHQFASGYSPLSATVGILLQLCMAFVLAQAAVEDAGRASREAQESNRRLRLSNFTVENVPVGIFWRTPDGRFRRVNRTACSMTGYSEEELLHMSVRDLDRQFSSAGMCPQLQKSKQEALESTHQHKDGHSYPVEIRSNFLEFEGVEYMVSFVNDITERKRSEETRNILSSVVEASRDFIGIGTPDGEMTYLNKAARSLVGLENFDTARPISAKDLFPPEELGSFVGVTMPALLRDGWVRTESRLRHVRTSQLIPVEVEGLVIRDPQGKVLCLATITRDLTERREAERSKAQLETRLLQAQKMEALGRLTGGIAHDFNNSLTVIQGYSALLASSNSLRPKDQEAVKAIADAGARSKELVRQLLGFSRQQIIAPQPLNLNQTMAESQHLLVRLVGEDIELQTLPGENLWDALLDSTQVYQVTMNLAANARDAMPTGGKLTLETANVYIDGADASQNPISHAGEYVLLAVTDTGLGMDAETAASVFEPFFTTKEMGKGTGLGLATVYGIVRQNHGFINVYTELGHGTTFKIYFPRYVNAKAAAPEEAQTSPGAGKGSGRILLVEDDELVRNMTEDALRFLGYTPVVAAHAQDAIEMCENLATPIDLVISDVVMPDMKGTDLRDRLVELRPGLNVLFMSGYTSNVIVPHGVLKPGVHFLQKPFSFDSLRAKIEEILV